MDQLTSVENTFENSLSCLAYPNPSNGDFHISYTSAEKATLNATLIDLSGRLLASDEWNVEPGSNIKDFSMRNIPPGFYLLKIAAMDGKYKVIRMEHR